MREILFRGKSVDNKGWLYGDLFRDYIPESDIPYWYINIRTEDQGTIPENVIPDTVGQYTELKDKNGKMIFEGDIVKHGTCAKSVVEYGWGKFIAHKLFNSKVYKSVDDYNNDEFMDLIEATWGDIEVIGNKYDNPELLGGGQYKRSDI